jgi:hypothetical protein
MTYRLNFSKEFQNQLYDFSKSTKDDNLNIFKNKLELWYIRNEETIEREYIYMRRIGYEGDIKDKIFKSSRYYLSKKNDKNIEKKKRKKYTMKNNKLIGKIKNHINDLKILIKPSEAYKNFYELHNNYINNYKDELMTNDNYSEKDALIKIKKIYKNKFYIHQKKSF